MSDIPHLTVQEAEAALKAAEAELNQVVPLADTPARQLTAEEQQEFNATGIIPPVGPNSE